MQSGRWSVCTTNCETAKGWLVNGPAEKKQHHPQTKQQPTVQQTPSLKPETSSLEYQEIKPKITNIKDLLKQGSIAFSQAKYSDAILAWQQVLEREPDMHPDIEIAIKDALGKVKDN